MARAPENTSHIHRAALAGRFCRDPFSLAARRRVSIVGPSRTALCAALDHAARRLEFVRRRRDHEFGSSGVARPLFIGAVARGNFFDDSRQAARRAPRNFSTGIHSHPRAGDAAWFLPAPFIFELAASHHDQSRVLFRNRVGRGRVGAAVGECSAAKDERK